MVENFFVLTDKMAMVGLGQGGSPEKK